MRRSSDRGQVEPLAALAAVLAVSAGIVVYASTLDARIPAEPERETASLVLDDVHRSLQTAGIAEPHRLDTATEAVPDGWQANLSLRTEDERWARGPVPPETAEKATTRVSVRLEPMRVRPGRLRVMLWR